MKNFKDIKWYLFVALALIMTSVLVYSLQLLIFGNPADTFFYLFQDLAFVPVSVLLVTLMMDKLLKKREKRSLLNKMNMVVGAFFVEMGNELLRLLNTFDQRSDEMSAFFCGDKNWSNKFIAEARKCVEENNFQPDLDKGDLEGLKDFLKSRRNVLMRMLENPNLMEHESFTDLLWALSHLTDELALRKSVKDLSKNDREHLLNDLSRAYAGMLKEWVAYMKHLQEDYPYMFSLAVRHNPFDRHAGVEFE